MEGVIPRRYRVSSMVALCYFAKLSQMERDFTTLTTEEQFAKRPEQENVGMDALLAWANGLKAADCTKICPGQDTAPSSAVVALYGALP